MRKIELVNVTRQYVTDKKESLYAVNNISLSFEDHGFVSITGKSGSGKSTILNMIGGLDNPTSGSVMYERINLAKLKGKRKRDYYKNHISILFQNCNLLEDEDVYFNIALPLFIKGVKEKKIKERVKQVFNLVGLKEELYKQKASVCSGGEKQRIALARCLVSEAEVLLCDEPTGALDSKNSKVVMDILKEYSKEHLVIMVSHNLQLVEDYSDRIIEITEGKISKDIDKLTKNDIPKHNVKRSKKSSKWINILSFRNIKKRFGRNLFSFFACLIALSSAFLSIGFIFGKQKSVDDLSLKQFDFGVATVQREEKISSESMFSLTRSTRPKLETLQNHSEITMNYDIYPNYDALIPMDMKVSYDEVEIDNLLYSPIESFNNTSINSYLLMDGYLPIIDSINEAVINNSAYEKLKADYNIDPLGKRLEISTSVKTRFIDVDETVVEDIFEFNESVLITGVVKEMNYLQNPKIYYSYDALDDYFENTKIENLSTYIGVDYSWKDRINDAEHFDSITSYSYRLFLKDVSKGDMLFESEELGDNLVITSSSLLIRSSLINFMDVAEYGLSAFLIVAGIGTLCVMSIMSFASYSEDHKVSAILTCFGADNSEIYEIYLNESFLIGFVALLFAFLASFGLSILINNLIFNLLELENLISIPLFTYLNIPYFFPLMMLIATIVISIISTVFPILFSKKIALKEELQSL